MMASNGSVWSYGQPDIKGKVNVNYLYLMQGFKFGENDTILVKVNFWMRTMTFRKDKESFTMKIDRAENYKLYACVCLHANNDAVSILPNLDYSTY